MISGKCPLKTELGGYVSGTLDEDSVQSIANHIEECPICEETISNLESSDDTFTSKLRIPNQKDAYLEEEGCDRAIELVKAIGLEPSVVEGVTQAATVSPRNRTSGDEPAVDILGKLGQYELLEKLGQGGMGAVYKAKHTRLRRIVALKVLAGNLLQDESAVARFDREMHAVGQLDHPNIVRASDAGEIDGTHYLVMELVKGADLAVVASRRGPLAIADACEVIRQTAVGLGHANEKGLVHRDIKPSNLMLTNDGQVKILDMGLALLETPLGDDGLTSSGQMVGTLDYIAPEQVSNSHAVDIRADIYSLGCSLYRLLCGKAPFQGEQYGNVVLKAMAHVNATPPPMSELRDGLSPQVVEVVDKMMAKKPDDRFQTPLELVEALAPLTVGHNLPALLNDSVVATHGGSETPTVDLALANEDTTGDFSNTPRKKPATKTPLTALLVGGSGWVTGNGVKIAAACFGGFLALLAVVVIYLPTPNGTIRIEIEDPTIQVTVSGDQRYQVKGKDGQFEVVAGQHNLHITAGETTFQTKEFTLGKGEEVSLRVTLLAGNIVQVAEGDAVLDEHALSPDSPVDGKSIGATWGTAESDVDEPRIQVRPFPALALEFDGVDDYVELPPLPVDGATPFTLEAVFLSQVAMNTKGGVVYVMGPAGGGFLLSDRVAENLCVSVGGAADATQQAFTGTRAAKIKWMHVAVICDGDKVHVYGDGERLPGNHGFVSRYATKCLIGARPGTAEGMFRDFFRGQIAAVRVSQGIRYQQDFQPPQELTSDEQTVGVYQFDEGAGDVLRDSSGNEHHGKIIGAKWMKTDKGVSESPTSAESETGDELLSNG